MSSSWSIRPASIQSPMVVSTAGRGILPKGTMARHRVVRPRGRDDGHLGMQLLEHTPPGYGITGEEVRTGGHRTTSGAMGIPVMTWARCR